MATASGCNVLDEFERLSSTLSGEFDQSQGPQSALRDWSLLSNWIMQFVNEAKAIPGFMENLHSKSSLSERVASIVAVEDLKISMETTAEEMINICETREQKSLDKAKVYLSIGLRFYDNENYEKAIELLNRALLYAPYPQDVEDEDGVKAKNLFSMILANRCRAFRIQKRHEQALVDLDNAIKFSCDPKFTEGLFDAREEVEKELRESGTGRGVYEPEQFAIRDEFKNQVIHGAVSILKMAYKPKIGRHLVSTRLVRPGVAIISEQTFAHWLAPSYYASYCAHCLRPLNEQPWPCRYCTYFRYCTEDCYDESWDNYHGLECKYMPVLKYFANGHLAVRMILMNGIENSIDDYHEVLAKEKFPVEARMIYRTRLKDVLTFTTHEDHIDKLMTTGTFTAAFLTIFCRTLQIIDNEMMDDFGGLLLKLLAIIRVNSLLISDNTKKDEEGDEFVSVNNRRAEIGAGVFGATSFVNHSCDHNCNRVFVGNRMIISAAKDIYPEEEITITYGPSAERYSYSERQKMILERYFFKCACIACSRRA